MTTSILRTFILPLLLVLSPAASATYMNLGGLGLETVTRDGVIENTDIEGVDWYTEVGSVDEAFFYFDVYDFNVTANMSLKITVEVDPASNPLLFPFVYLFRPGNAPDIITPLSIWTKFDDIITEIDFYLPLSPADPTGPLIVSDTGAPSVLDTDVLSAEPDYRLMVTGGYHRVTDGNFWDLPKGDAFGNYSVTITGTRNATTVPAPATWVLLGLGLFTLWHFRRPGALAAMIRARS